MHFNDTLAVRLPLDGTMLIGAGRDGVKLGWIRIRNGALAVTAKRLDVSEIVEVDMTDNYGDSGLQVTDRPPLTFVTRVLPR